MDVTRVRDHFETFCLPDDLKLYRNCTTKWSMLYELDSV